MRRLGTGLVLIALGVVVVAVRGVGFEHVFSKDVDGVVLTIDDAQYHARRAGYTYENFPAVLSFDPYLNFPRGAPVPWPPLYDFALGAAGRLVGSLDLVLAWASVVFGLLTALGVYGVGRMLAGHFVGACAVGFFALLPASTLYSSVGNPDHHAVVAFLATVLLVVLIGSLGAPERAPRVWALQAIGVVARVAMLLSWHGSILYIALAESLGLLVAVVYDRRGLLLAQAAGCGLAAALGFSALGLPHSEFGGAWSAIELSRLQPTALAVFSGAALVGALSHGLGSARRLVLTALAAIVAGGVVLALSWDGIAGGWSYLTREEPFIARNFEAQPLWQSGGVDFYGYATWLLPLTPLAGLLAARRRTVREPALALAGWTTALGILAVSNARYGSDFAPAASVSFALLLAASAEALSTRAVGHAAALRLVAALSIPVWMLPTLRASWPHALRSLSALAGHEVVVQRPGLGLSRSVYAFVDAVREATPEPGDAPEYGILTPNLLGLVMNARGGRPTPAGNFGPYVGRDGFELTRRFYRTTDEREAFRELVANRIRYVVTSDGGTGAPASMLQRLYHDDGGAAGGRPALGHFRLVTEAPARGVPLGALGGVAPDFVDAPYKLFEVVPGAVLNVRGSPPGRPVSVELQVATATGRTFLYRTSARAAANGVARVRVPYAAPDYVVRTQTGRHEVGVLEDQILSGGSLDVP